MVTWDSHKGHEHSSNSGGRPPDCDAIAKAVQPDVHDSVEAT